VLLLSLPPLRHPRLLLLLLLPQHSQQQVRALVCVCAHLSSCCSRPNTASNRCVHLCVYVLITHPAAPAPIQPATDVCMCVYFFLVLLLLPHQASNRRLRYHVCLTFITLIFLGHFAGVSSFLLCAAATKYCKFGIQAGRNDYRRTFTETSLCDRDIAVNTTCSCQRASCNSCCSVTATTLLILMVIGEMPEGVI